jgi:predicted nuclease with TOPRIM domain
LDREIILQQFEEIERKVDRVIETCNRYEKANSELKEKIELLEEELQSKVEAETRHRTDKDLIRSKIDTLLGKLAEIPPAQQALSTSDTDLEG